MRISRAIQAAKGGASGSVFSSIALAISLVVFPMLLGGCSLSGKLTQQLASETSGPLVMIGSVTPASGSSSTGFSWPINYIGASQITLSANDITLSGTATSGCTKSVTGTGSLSRTVTISGCAGTGLVGILIAPGTATDAAGSLASAAGPSDSASVSNGGPSLTISAPSVSQARSASSITYTIAYLNAATVSLAPSDINFGGAATSGCSASISGSGFLTRTVTVTGCTGNGTMNISVAADSARDISGSPALGGGPSADVTIDNQAPTVTVSSTAADPTQTTPVPITVQFSEGVTGFTSSDVTLSGGTISNFTDQGSGRYTFDLNLNDKGAFTVQIAGHVASDLAGNGNTAATPFSIESDISTLADVQLSLEVNRVNISKGAATKTVTLNLSPAAPISGDFPYQVYGSGASRFSEVFKNSGGTIHVNQGDTQVALQFGLAANSGLAGSGHIGLVIQGASQKVLDLGLYQAGAREFNSISGGYATGCGIKSGKLYCWGKNHRGQVGNGGSPDQVNEPVQVGASTTWTQISAGDTTCGIDNGKLYCWGENSYGAVGNGAGSGQVNTPEQVGSSTTWTQVSTSGYNTCGIDSGKLYCWCANDSGQIGNGTTGAAVNVPVRIGSSTTWTQVAAGVGTTCGIDSGKLYCWGSNNSGQLGNGNAGINVTAPAQIGTSTTWTHVSIGSSHTCGIDSGKLYCWGANTYGQLGNGTFDVFTLTDTPLRIGSSAAWTQVAAGSMHTCGIDNGKIYCWGNNEHCAVGDGSNCDFSTLITAPTQIGSSTTWTQVSAGGGYTCGLMSGELQCWGGDSLGQTANGSDLPSQQITAAPVQANIPTSWAQLEAGGNHTCGIAGGKLYCWGYNDGGQVGDGSGVRYVILPERIGRSTSWTQVATGWGHSCGIDAGKLYCWGGNWSGQVGDGTTTDALQPVQIGTSHSWTSVAAGDSFTCGIDAGKLYCWGSNSYGALGIGTDGNFVTTPTRVGSSSTWTVVSGGGEHTCGVDSGKLYCWGANWSGQVGDGSSNEATLPIQIGNSTTWTQVTLGVQHTCGIDNGKLFCWGANDDGQLGNGSADYNVNSLPVQVGSATTWTQLSAGYYFMCGIESGKLFCWGANWSGNLGDGTFDDVYAPKQIGASTTWTQVTSGDSHVYGVNNGVLYGWGEDKHYQIPSRFLNTNPGK